MKPLYHLATLALCLFLSLHAAAQTADILVSSRNTHSVKRYNADGNYLGDFVAPGDGGLVNPQDVLFHPDGTLLVTGIGNTDVKRYDGRMGTFLGNFTSGYDLDRPTKMSIGPDGNLYVSQWGASRNKIVRFNLQTGVFIGEFSETGVPQGCGHAWDTGGNLYVPSWGQGANGNVYKFGPDGSFLGIVINSDNLQGPVGLWIDDAGDFLVADWTLGQVRRFRPNGDGFDYEGAFITGMVNIEGHLLAEDGSIFLCDWTQNHIRKYTAEGAPDGIFASAGSMMAPNALTFMPLVSSAGAAMAGSFRFDSIFPNPVSEEAAIRFTLPSATLVKLELLTPDGRMLETLAEGRYEAGSHEVALIAGHRPNGVYLCRLQAEGKEVVRKFTLAR